MVGTDTFTPERLHYIPDHANWSRAWMADLPADLAERIAWRNAQDLIMPIWRSNRAAGPGQVCGPAATAGAPALRLDSEQAVLLFTTTPTQVSVGQRFAVLATICPKRSGASVQALSVDATMPEHRHGMNYTPQVSRAGDQQFRADGLLMHMPGRWQMSFDLRIDGKSERLLHDLIVR
jgi:hypothetical protein